VCFSASRVRPTYSNYMILYSLRVLERAREGCGGVFLGCISARQDRFKRAIVVCTTLETCERSCVDSRACQGARNGILGVVGGAVLGQEVVDRGGKSGYLWLFGVLQPPVGGLGGSGRGIQWEM
jgi:hypothetical protein